MTTEIQRRWDLWHLRTLFPDWGAAERDRLLRAGAACDARMQDLLADPEAALARHGDAARAVLREAPELEAGLVVSLHLGPYSLAPVPWLVAGRDVQVLVNRSSLREIGPLAAVLHERLRLPGRLRWTPIDGAGFALDLARALRDGRPVLAYLDGNDGLEGCEGTLRHGVPFDLPGRRIRVRTGLARLALRLGRPVHSLVTVLGGDGFRWQRGPTWSWPAGTDPAAATAELFGWAFGVIRRHPEQWRAWNMLTGVCESFRRADGADGAGGETPTPDPERARRLADPDRRHRLLEWRRPAEIWPGDMLEDVQGECFYAAAGLTAADVARWSAAGRFTFAEVAAARGEDWARAHLPRLAALGFLGPASPDSRG